MLLNDLSFVVVELSNISRYIHILYEQTDKNLFEQFLNNIRVFNKTLWSFGHVTSSINKSINDVFNNAIKQITKELDEVDQFTNSDYIELYIDSGGFQALTGRLKKSVLYKYIDTYHEAIKYIVDYFKTYKTKSGKKVYVKMFSLDIPPCTKNCDSDSVDVETALNATKDSYKQLAQLTDYKDNIIVVFHVGFKDIAKLFYDIFESNPELLSFPNWSTSTMRKYANVNNCTYIGVAYAYLKSLNITKPNQFHFLGVSSPKFAFPLFYWSMLYGYAHNTNIIATYDSATYSAAMSRGLARFILNNKRYNFDLKTDLSKYKSVLSKKLEQIGFTKLNLFSNDTRLTREIVRILFLLWLEAVLYDELDMKQLAYEIFEEVKDGKLLMSNLMRITGKNSTLIKIMSLDYSLLHDLQFALDIVKRDTISENQVLDLIGRYIEPLPFRE